MTDVSTATNRPTAASRPPTGVSIAMTGASGLIGGALRRTLAAAGHRVIPVVRHPPSQDEIGWDPEQNRIDSAGLEGLDAVIHLAGESVAQRWTASTQERILRSRERGTTLLSTTLARLKRPPKSLVSASAIGIYGNRGGELLPETASIPGTNSASFLARVGTIWEQSTAAAAAAGIRVVHLRTGIVLTPRGGALKPMLIPFRLGLGGRLGSGRQWMSWITLDDLLSAYHHCLTQAELTGAVNGVAPNPVINQEFTRILAELLHRPAIFPVPAPILHLLLGTMADELLLYSQRVVPSQLEQSGYNFKFPELKSALVHLLSQ